MRDPKRILEKILGNGYDLDGFEQTGEPLELVVHVLRDVVKCRRTRQWIADSYDIDVAVSPETFHGLLDIPQINFIENSNRMLEVETVSLKDTREPGDPVTIGNLNAVLRELYRNLESVQGRLQNEYPDPLLIGEMRGGWIDPLAGQTQKLNQLHGKLTGYLFNLGKVKAIEQEFEERFPQSVKAHPLRRTWPLVERELGFYRQCRDVNERWKEIGLDLFRVMREDGLSSLRENIQEMGNLLWNIVYNRKPVEQCLERVGLEFNDTRSLFDENQVTINNV
ncbi:hypothetical protein UZ36_03415 [Candidatus Nitromaritima sp. SCGC AAA799-C22]|nr:hypothetical protein UZ36_03415 [Candidatus Nitromaritima sp. SCGC AAA799-C22]